MSLVQLDVPTRVRLRSTQILTSLPQIVSELVQNSLDADATRVDVGVDCQGWMCWVKDNGSGISKEGLTILSKGLEDGRYGTSKAHDSDLSNTLATFGFRGEALASAADLACLEVSSRTASSRDTWSLILKGSKALYTGLAVRWRQESPGTVVCIRDAFYNLPVRRLSHPSPSRSFDLVRQELETYALVFPHVSFSLENLYSGNEATTSKNRIIRIPKTSSTLLTFRNIYGRALTEHVEEIDISSGSLRLNGFISLSGAHSKGYQFLYINCHPIAHCDLHHIVDSAFASSSFHKNAFDEAGEMDLPRSAVRRPPRKVEKKPVYVLNLTIPPPGLDNCMEPAKLHVQLQDRRGIGTLLSSCVESFLIRHGFKNTGEVNSALHRSDDNSPRKRRKGIRERSPEYTGQLEAVYRMDDEFLVQESLPAIAYPVENSQDVAWRDPKTGEILVFDSRTGNSRSHARPPPSTESAHEGRRTIPYVQTPEKPSDRGKSIPAWLQEALEENPVYKPTDISVPNLRSVSSLFLNSSGSIPISGVDFRHGHGASFSHQYSVENTDELNTSWYRFRKEDLAKACVINQVDNKFIACLVERKGEGGGFQRSALSEDSHHDAGPLLVLIDQHAADERIRVERFLKELCLGFMKTHGNVNDESSDGVAVRKIFPSIPVLLTMHEAQRLSESQEIKEAFRHWGFHFESFPRQPLPLKDDIDVGYSQVSVQGIPEIVADKLLLGDELRDLVKGFLGQLETEMPPTSMINSMDTSEESFTWLKALRWCPRGLLDLINSKACRGAIMFNDTLSKEQCESLVRQLSETVFPFQCAHGRPSLVPLTSIWPWVKGRQRRIAWTL